MKMRLALFDFDGTISSKDSLADFIIYVRGKPRYYLGLIVLSPVLLAWKLKLLQADTAKSRLIAHFFKGWGESAFKNIASQYSIERLDCIVRPLARNKIAWHQERGDEVVVVSASMQCWLQAWCQQQGVELIATKLAFEHQKLTGELAGKNCQGREKVRRIKAQYDLQQFDTIYAYGDSDGDREMLALAHEVHYRPFR